MLLPQELKNHKFTRALRGYAADEVDDYVALVIAKYEEVYRENDETGRKLSAAMKALEELRAREKKIAALEASIRRAAEQILAEADQKRRQIVADAEEYADRIVAEADAHVASQEQQFLKMQREAAAFRDTLFAAYSSHIDRLEELAAAAVEEAFTDPVPAAALTEAAEEIAPSIPAEAEAETAEADQPEETEDVYSEEELYGNGAESETAEAADEDTTYTLEAADEDVYSEEELTDTEESAPEEEQEEPEQMEMILPDEPAAEEEIPEEAPIDAAVFSALFAEANGEAADTEFEELPWEEDSGEAEEIVEIPENPEKPENKEDDLLLRELHEVFSREFAAVKEDEPSEKQTIFLPIEEPAEQDDDDKNLSELKKQMGLSDEKPSARTNDFDFLPEQTEEESGEKHFGFFGKKK